MQHQDYDKIFKENIAKVASSLVEKLCGIAATNWENVSRSIPRTIERRTDIGSKLVQIPRQTQP
jgi:hypothetical protein